MKAIIFLLIVLPVFANASTFTFSYTYSDNSILQGTLDGTVQGDLDTVFINSFGSVNYFGTDLSSIELTDFMSLTDFINFPSGVVEPLVSFSGASMDIFVCPNGLFTGPGPGCIFATQSGFWFTPTQLGVGDGLGNTLFEEFNAANWHLSAVSSTDDELCIPIKTPDSKFVMICF